MFDSKEYFDQVRAAAGSLEAARTRRKTMTLSDRRGAVGGRTSNIGDPTCAQALALEALDSRIAQLESEIGEANLVINAIGEEISQDVALVFALYYIDLREWDEIAFEMHWSLSTLYRRRNRAHEWVSKIGLASARERGSACQIVS